MNLRLTCEPVYTNEDLRDIEMTLHEADLPEAIAEPVLITANLGLKLIYMNWGCWGCVEAVLTDGGVDDFQSVVQSVVALPATDPELSEEQATKFYAIAYDFARSVAHHLDEAQTWGTAMEEFALENGFHEAYQNGSVALPTHNHK